MKDTVCDLATSIAVRSAQLTLHSTTFSWPLPTATLKDCKTALGSNYH